jgi:hypothetical protein
VGCDDDPAPPAPVDAAAGDAGVDVPMAGEAGHPDAALDVTAPPDLPPFSAGTVNLVGRVVSAGAAAAPIAEAKVTASIDRDHDGTIELAEEVVGMSGADGQFALDVTVMPGEVLVVKIEKELMAPILRTIEVAGGAQIALEVAAAALEQLTCAAGKCTSADGALAIEGMPSWASAVGAAFNPVTDTAQFPGAFADSTGALLKSAAFAALELRDAQGAKIQALPMPASLRLQIPPDTHVLVEDMKPGTDRIEVPMYAFNG